MSGAREDKPAEPAAPVDETEDDLRLAIEEEAERATDADDDDPELEPEEDADPEPARRTREERDRLREERRELEEETRQRRALLERERLQSQPRIDPARQAQLDQDERERVAMMPLHEQFEYWEAKATQRQAQLRAETDDMFGRMQFDQRVRELQLPYSYRLQAENLMAEYRAQGMNATWDHVLTQVMGQYWLDRAPEREREAEERTRQRQRRIASQTVPLRMGRASPYFSAAGLPIGDRYSSERRRSGQNQDAEDEALLRSITWGEANR